MICVKQDSGCLLHILYGYLHMSLQKYRDWQCEGLNLCYTLYLTYH